MTLTLNPLLLATPHPPIPEIQGWAVESPHRGGLPVADRGVLESDPAED